MYNKQMISFFTQALIACGGALCLIGGQLHAANLLTNGSFESGDTGFSTDYANYFNGTTSLHGQRLVYGRHRPRRQLDPQRRLGQHR